MNKAEKFLIVLFLSVILTTIVQAAPTKFQTTPDNGCEISPVFRESLKVGQSFDFNFHVFNKTNGMPISGSTISCYFHLYNQTGDHSYFTILTNDPISEHNVINEWAARLSGTNFTSVGTYAYLVQCNGTAIYGGCADKGGFSVTDSGYVITSANTTTFQTSIIIFLVMAIFFLIIGLNIQNTAFKIILMGIGGILLFMAVLYNAVFIGQTFSELPDVVEGFATFLMVLKILLGIFIVGLLIAALVFSYNLWMVRRGFKQ